MLENAWTAKRASCTPSPLSSIQAGARSDADAAIAIGCAYLRGMTVVFDGRRGTLASSSDGTGFDGRRGDGTPSELGETEADGFWTGGPTR